jgi:hypothetical protein
VSGHVEGSQPSRLGESTAQSSSTGALVLNLLIGERLDEGESGLFAPETLMAGLADAIFVRWVYSYARLVWSNWGGQTHAALDAQNFPTAQQDDMR